MSDLRQYADDAVTRSELFTRAAADDADAIKRVFLGYWPIVDGFGALIDRRCQGFASKLRPVLRGWRTLPGELRDMAREELEHRSCWVMDAARHGIEMPASYSPVPAVGQLLAVSAQARPSVFFIFLWATECMAEALSHGMRGQMPLWAGEHLRHEGMHSEIDRRLAQMLGSSDGFLEIYGRRICDLYGRAAEQLLCLSS